MALQRQGDNEKLWFCAVKKLILTNINSLFQVNFTWLHYMEFFSWGQAFPTWTRLMLNTEKEKLLMKVNSPQLCFLRGGEIQVLSLMWLIRVILFEGVYSNNTVIIRPFLRLFTDFGFFSPKCFYGHNAGYWQRDGRCWVVTKGGGGDCDCHWKGHGNKGVLSQEHGVLSHMAWFGRIQPMHVECSVCFLPAWTPNWLWFFHCSAVFISVFLAGGDSSQDEAEDDVKQITVCPHFPFYAGSGNSSQESLTIESEMKGQQTSASPAGPGLGWGRPGGLALAAQA